MSKRSNRRTILQWDRSRNLGQWLRAIPEQKCWRVGMFMVALPLACLLITVMAQCAYVLFAQVGFLQDHLINVLRCMQSVPHIFSIVWGTCLWFTDIRPNGRLSRLRLAVERKIYEGDITRLECAAFAVVGTILVFWLQFSGVLVLDFNDRRGGTPQLMKRLSEKGPLFEPVPVPQCICNGTLKMVTAQRGSLRNLRHWPDMRGMHSKNFLV